MSAVTEAIYDALAGDATLVAMLATYGGEPAIFTTDPAPGDAELPYIVSAGEVAARWWWRRSRSGCGRCCIGRRWRSRISSV